MKPVKSTPQSSDGKMDSFALNVDIAPCGKKTWYHRPLLAHTKGVTRQVDCCRPQLLLDFVETCCEQQMQAKQENVPLHRVGKYLWPIWYHPAWGP